jgi:hypothetical protein
MSANNSDVTEDVYISSAGEYDGHQYQGRVIVTMRSGAPFAVGDSPMAQGLSTLANFLYIVDGDSATPYEAAIVKIQVPTARELGLHFICMRCRPGSADWERLPRIGFDAPLVDCGLSEVQFAQLPAEASESQTVRDVQLTDAGRRWWHTVGPIYPLMYFDTAADSEACRILPQLPAEQGTMAVLESDEWQRPIPGPQVSKQQREADIERLLRWSVLWHNHLVDAYAMADEHLFAEQIAAGQDADDVPGDITEIDVDFDDSEA